MGGTEAEAKRKRKRKTRSERNNTVHRMVTSLDVPQESNKCKTCVVAKSETTAYSLRSCKPVLSPVEVKKTNGVSITRGRLTRRVGLFASIPTSQWISREPISEIGELGKEAEKKVQNISFRVVSEKSKNVHNIDQAGDRGSSVNEDGDNSSADERDIMLLGMPAFGPGQDNLPGSLKDRQEKKTSLDSVPDSITSNPSVKSSAMKEFLDPILPYQEIAESISKDLKLKMKKVFQSRNMEKEICSDLHKLLRQSSDKIPGPEMHQDILEKNAQCVNASCKENKSQKMEEVVDSSPCSSRSSFLLAPSRNADSYTFPDGDICPALSSDGPLYVTYTSDNRGISVQPQLELYPDCCVNSNISCCKPAYSSSDRCFQRSSSRTETASPKAMDIRIQKDEESDEEKTPALLLAQYHAFLLSSRKLNTLHKLQHQSAIEKETSHSNKSSVDSAIQNCDHPFCSCKSHCYGHHSHRNKHPYYKTTHLGQSHGHHLPFPSSYPSIGKPSFDNHKFKETEGCMPNHLEISRHRLKTALESASTKPQKRSSCNPWLDCSAPNRQSGLNFEDSNLRFIPTHGNDEPMDCSGAGPSLGQMKIHQTDMQFQARDFLDELQHEFNQSRWPSAETERHSLLSDSVLYGGRQSNAGYTWKGPSTQ